jgi:hypothetical protein
LDIRRDEFESAKITRFYEDNDLRYNLAEINKTYYGKKFIEILQSQDLSLKPEKFKKFHDFALKLNLHLKIIDLNP